MGLVATGGKPHTWADTFMSLGSRICQLNTAYRTKGPHAMGSLCCRHTDPPPQTAEPASVLPGQAAGRRELVPYLLLVVYPP